MHWHPIFYRSAEHESHNQVGGADSIAEVHETSGRRVHVVPVFINLATANQQW